MHRANLMHKLGLRTQAELIRYALRRGVIPLHE
jgi:DNA-binding CsgD family transcriptional regulator